MAIDFSQRPFQATRAGHAGPLMGPTRRVGPGRLAILVLALACTLAQQLAADSMRCGRKVVRTGDSPAALLEHCGEPKYRGRGYAEVNTKDGRQAVKVEQWHYKRSERSLERIVLIYRGEIVAVETGSR